MQITIGREIGSGGREIGKKLSEKLGYAYFDNNLLTLAAKESGLCPEEFIKADESNEMLSRRSLSLPFSAYMSSETLLSPEKLFQIQSEVILNLAKKKSCVFIGRCADYVLRERQDCLSVFITASELDCIKRIAKRQKISLKQADEVRHKINKRRAAYYNFYTEKKWGDADSYDMSINSSLLGIDGTVDMIVELIEKVEHKQG